MTANIQRCESERCILKAKHSIKKQETVVRSHEKSVKLLFNINPSI